MLYCLTCPRSYYFLELRLAKADIAACIWRWDMLPFASRLGVPVHCCCRLLYHVIASLSTCGLPSLIWSWPPPPLIGVLLSASGSWHSLGLSCRWPNQAIASLSASGTAPAFWAAPKSALSIAAYLYDVNGLNA